MDVPLIEPNAVKAATLNSPAARASVEKAGEARAEAVGASANGK